MSDTGFDFDEIDSVVAGHDEEFRKLLLVDSVPFSEYHDKGNIRYNYYEGDAAGAHDPDPEYEPVREPEPGPEPGRDFGRKMPGAKKRGREMESDVYERIETVDEDEDEDEQGRAAYNAGLSDRRQGIHSRESDFEGILADHYADGFNDGNPEMFPRRGRFYETLISRRNSWGQVVVQKLGVRYKGGVHASLRMEIAAGILEKGRALYGISPLNGNSDLTVEREFYISKHAAVVIDALDLHPIRIAEEANMYFEFLIHVDGEFEPPRLDRV